VLRGLDLAPDPALDTCWELLVRAALPLLWGSTSVPLDSRERVSTSDSSWPLL